MRAGVHVQVCQVKGKKMGKEVREREGKKRPGREGGGEEQIEEGGGERKRTFNQTFTDWM